MVSTGAALLITTVVLLAGSARTQAQDLNVTRYVAIGAQTVVRLPVQVPVKLDCRPLAVRTFGNQLNLSSITWTHGDFVIRDNDTVRNVLLSPNNLCLILSELKIRTGAEDGTEALITCTACSNDPPGRECRSFSTRVIANSPPILECTDPPRPVPPLGFGNLNFGCDMCVERGQSALVLTLDCTPDTKRLPTNCTIRSPEGIRAEDLDDETTFVISTDQITINGEIMNPENPAPPVVLGTWTCTCVNSDGTTTAMSRIGSCLVPPKIDRGEPRRNITDFPPYLSEGGRSFKIGGNEFVITGNQFTILCNIIEGIPPPQITWTRDGIALPRFNNMSSITIPVNKTDPEAAAGQYRCRAENAAGSDEVPSFMRVGLEIFEPPVIKRGPKVDPPTNVSIGDKTADIGSDVYVIRGSGVTIMCDLEQPGLPRGDITWTRNARPFSDAMLMEFVSNMGTRLQFASTNDSSEAYYCCKAENLAGADEACSSVFLRGGGPNIRKGFMFPRPVNPELVTLSRRVTTDIGGSAYATVGAEIEVMCPVTFAEPDVMTFTWMFTNAAGTSFPISPTFTTIPGTNEMSGMVTVDGDVDITVFQNIPRQTSRILINSNRTGYNVTCSAMSPLGMDTATTNFAAYAPPVINPEGIPSILPPEVPIGPRTQNIGSTFHMVSGGDLTVNCPSTGAIPPGSEDYAWYYQGKLVMDQTNFTDSDMNMIGKFFISTNGGMSTLTIRNVSRSSNGDVQCTVFNPAGSDVSSSRVRVYSDVLIAKGPNITIGPEESTGTVGNKFLLPRGKRAYINCGFAETGGFPYNESVSLPAAIQWSFNGVPVDPDLYSQLHGNQLCVDLILFNLTGNDNFECKSTSRITDGVMRQMDMATSNVMLVDGPVIDRDALPDDIPDRKRVSFGSGVNRVIEAGTNVDIRCRINETMPQSALVWNVDTGDGDVQISSTLNPKYMISGSGATLDLSISNFGAGEVGCYSCNAENSVSMDNARVCLSLCPADSSRTPCNISSGSFVVSLPQEHPEDLCPFCSFYFTSRYGPCVPPCHAGFMNRIVECLSGSRIIDLEVCANRSAPISPIPISTRNCSDVYADNERSCLLEPKWMIGPWSMCTRTCEGGIQTRQVMCRIPASGKLVPDYECAAVSVQPITWRRCYKYIPCGCEDYSESCKYIGGSRCLQMANFLACCKTCSQGRPRGHGPKSPH